MPGIPERSQPHQKQGPHAKSLERNLEFSERNHWRKFSPLRIFSGAFILISEDRTRISPDCESCNIAIFLRQGSGRRGTTPAVDSCCGMAIAKEFAIAMENHHPPEPVHIPSTKRGEEM